MPNVQQLIAAAFPTRRIAGCEPLPGGLINSNFKIHFEGDFDPIVLRVYRDGPAACKKELAVYNLIKNTVPVAEILYADSGRLDGSPAFAVVEYVEGITFQQLKRTNDLAAIQQAATSAGKTLAAIGRFQFSAPGDLIVQKARRKLTEETTAELTIGDKFIDGPDPIPRLLDRFLASPVLQRRADTKLIDCLHNFIWSHASTLPLTNDDRSLVHNDFGNRNILVREENGTWRVAAVLDWELAFSGSPLLDVGHFLRYERNAQPLREPYFSRAFVEHGGRLPDNWQLIVKLIDLTGLVECLTHEQLPDDVEAELFDLIHSTLAMA